MTMFEKLRSLVGDDPDEVIPLSREDKSVQKLCNDLFLEEFFLRDSERTERQLFSAPVNKKFIQVWRDYEDRYDKPVSDAFFINSGLDVSDLESDEISEDAGRWQNADEAAAYQLKCLSIVLHHIRDRSDNGELYDDEFKETIDEALKTWVHLRQRVGLNIREIFRRRELIPFILVPEHVAKKHGHTEKLSLFAYLQQAQDAFILGVPFAAYALMRSLLELVLSKHYPAFGDKLEKLIDSCHKLPEKVSKVDLHRIRYLGKDILHFNKDTIRLPANEEKEIIRLFNVLRRLIENAPQ